MKNNYFYKKALSNIYKKPSKVSEVTSQIIYGEKFKILSKNKSWLKIQTLYDNYIGYIKDESYTEYHNHTHKIFTLKTNIFNKQKNKTKYFLPFASIQIATCPIQNIISPFLKFFILMLLLEYFN